MLGGRPDPQRQLTTYMTAPEERPQANRVAELVPAILDGKVTALLEPVRVPNNPDVPLSEDLFRATVAAGECQGGFAQHGLARCVVFGRVAGINAAKRVA
jgi:hypothetical protein